MPLPSQPQRVALAKSKTGEPVYIEREWLKIFQEISAPSDSTSSTGNAVLAAQIATLSGQLTALEARVRELEQGYHL